jgi:predicted amidohydrolase YtcJ
LPRRRALVYHRRRTARPEVVVDLILVGGRIWTFDPDLPEATALAIRGDRIAAVGDDAAILALARRGTRRVDLDGALVVPGLVDAHGHVRSLGERLSGLDLRGLATSAAIVARVRERVAGGVPAGGWITGGGWDQNIWPDTAFPTHEPLTDAAPRVPVFLRRIDGHAGWANRAALDAAGLGPHSADPPGGRIERDARGEPTGILIDNAMALLEAARPRPTRAELKGWIRTALQRLAKVGLTGVHDAGVPPEEVAAYRELADEEALPLRVYLMWDGTKADPIEPLVERDPFVDYGGRLTLRALKLMVDGALGSRGAVLFGDYDDARGQRGLFVTEPAEIERRSVLALGRGYQVAVHAIGDRGVAEVIAALERALQATSADDPRPRIEHLQCVRRADLERARRLGAVASMQPSHATSDMLWAEARLGPERGRGLYAWRWVAEAGLPLAAGSDFPVDPEPPLFGLHAAVTRCDRAGRPSGGWHPEQRLALEEAVRAYTWGAAYAAFEERHAGRVGAGYRADLTILSEDLRAIPPQRIHEVAVRGVIVGGQVAYDAC